ncbi:MAG: DUF502 domain-containing protein [Alicyclobacillus sp.]|nr:DUF502 domain-containing protein [Alicyclobacillus sp.]
MFRQIASHFVMGLVTVLPFALVIWVLVTIFRWVDGLLGPYVDNWIGIHVPGVGFVLVLLATTAAGALTKLYVSHRILLLIESLFTKIPLVKSLYSMFKELIESLVGHKRGFREAVLVEWPDERALVLGLVTSDRLPPELDPDGTRVSVYLPNTFQFTGVTVIVERKRLHPCDLTVEEAFKFTITAGLGHASPGSRLAVDGEPFQG